MPVQFRVESGNATDDRSHRGTWELLCQLTGRRDFLYVADCKLATAENRAHIHQHGGRFLSVLPRTRSEDAAFRAVVSEGRVAWRRIHDRLDDDGALVDRFSICEPPTQTAEGYRLIWYHSVRKAELDASARLQRIERAMERLNALRQKLASPRTRYRAKAKVAEAVEVILRECDAAAWITVEIAERTTEKYRQERRGQPGEKTRYVKQERLRFDLTHRIDLKRLDEESRCDGIFPLITNDRAMSELQLLLAYKQQPAMARAGIESLPLYPERRACRRPTARRVIDLFEDVRRHTLTAGKKPPVVFTTELTRVQRKIPRLLGMSKAYDR